LKKEYEITLEVIGKQTWGKSKTLSIFSMQTLPVIADSCQEISSDNSGFWPTVIWSPL
tara:strand:- start:415 stop:588 length:174 start_codon:yes stop_codon:yes gene_type:complete